MKNNGRIQLTLLFLKEIGLSSQECLLFFNHKFIKKQSDFKNHPAYFIQHQYGLKGGFKNYSPVSGSKIACKSGNKIDNDDQHACPFKLFQSNQNALNKITRKYYNINIDIKSNNNAHPTIQCKQLFNVLNKNQLREQHSMDIDDHGHPDLKFY